jgi:hypothetical protein
MQAGGEGGGEDRIAQQAKGPPEGVGGVQQVAGVVEREAQLAALDNSIYNASTATSRAMTAAAVGSCRITRRDLPEPAGRRVRRLRLVLGGWRRDRPGVGLLVIVVVEEEAGTGAAAA